MPVEANLKESDTDKMPDHAADTSRISRFIETWGKSAAAERANYQGFLYDLCDVLGVPRPEPAKADPSRNSYVFEHPVVFDDGLGQTSTGFIDLYHRGHFVLEAKQGSEREAREDETGLRVTRRGRRGTAVRGTQGWDVAMLAARGQAELYAKALPVSEGWPPFLVVVDVGHSIELYADFSRSGKTYVAFPDARTHRIFLRDLTNDEILDRLRLVWTAPLELDPSLVSAKVTREVAEHLADLARSFEKSEHEPGRVAQFLMRCLFTMFAEDIELLPKKSFQKLLEGRRGKLDTFPEMIGSLWTAMDRGEFWPILERKLPRFNGELFKNCEVLPVTEPQLDLLIEAANADWKAVEPAIFGTLLERALDPEERSKLGAHYTPRAYVERLVIPTIVEPLREEWEAAKAAAVTQANAGKLEEAREEIHDFLNRLCSVTVLDPACGTGNFLYVTLEHLKRLEGEARDALVSFGDTQEVFEGVGLTVDPTKLLGIEKNERAAAIAELVLWIGYLQWHYRTFDTTPHEPIIKEFHSIDNRDAVLEYDSKEPLLDTDGNLVTEYDGVTKRTHPVTGREVPDTSAQIQVFNYVNPRIPDWPKADFIVGNPPFIGKLNVIDLLDSGYTEALRNTYESVPDSADFVMYWWYRAAQLAASGDIKRFGYITTNSITQHFNSQIVAKCLRSKTPLHIVYAIPDHPWIDSQTAASVRIAMTVGTSGTGEGRLDIVTSEKSYRDYTEVELEEHRGIIHANLRVGVNVLDAKPLRANKRISGTGLILGNRGFVLTREEMDRLLVEHPECRAIIHPLRHGKDVTDLCRDLFVIDPHGLTRVALERTYPAVFQRLMNLVYDERQANRDPRLRENWWLFRRTNEKIRAAISGLSRYIVTSETSRHRMFTFLNGDVKPEHKLVVIGSDDAYVLGVLSSRIHVVWSLAAGGWLGVGNDSVYSKTLCFEKFPFPDASEASKVRIRELGERLHAHRLSRQASYPSLILTDIYNILGKLRTGEPLNESERLLHEQGLVSALKQICDDLDAEVAAAYGWSIDLDDEGILARVVALNSERVLEEARGEVRWLRPDLQNPSGHRAAVQINLIGEAEGEEIDVDEDEAKYIWPKTLSERVRAVRSALVAQKLPVTPEQLARRFVRARSDVVEQLLETLASLGHARELSNGSFIASPSNK